jgi:DNA recombination protein RmuC
MNEADSPIGLVLLLLALGAVVAAVFFFLEARRERAERFESERKLAAADARLEQLDAARSERDAAQQERAAAVAEAGQTRAALAAERSAAEARLQAAREKEEALLAMKTELEKTFLGMAHQALAQSEQRFLNLANETFEKHQQGAAGGVKEVIGPVQEQFAKLSESIAALDKARTEDKSALGEQLRQVAETLQTTQTVTGTLANALRAAPKARGRWGEEGLRNVLELAGLTAHIDFDEQSSHDSETGKLRPDVIIKVPGGRCIVVDSKVALSGYLDAVDAPDEAARAAFMKKHAAEMRTHMRLLASKEYAKHVPATADFVVMFVPGENFLAAALEQDPSLFHDGWADKVVIAGPASLLALAKSIAYGWRQEEVAENAEQIAKLGGELYGRLATMAGRLDALGNSLEKSVKSYNELVSTTETRVFPSARKFRDLGAGDTSAEITEPKQIELTPRLPLLSLEAEEPKPRKKAG